MLDLTSGAESTSRVPLRRPEESFVAALNSALPSLRIGVAVEAPGGKRPNDEIGTAVEEMAHFLGRAGHAVGSFVFPASANIGDAALVIWLTAIAEEIDFYQKSVGRPPEADELEALTWESIAVGKRSSAIDYVRARRALTRATRDMAEASKHFDVLLLPTTADHAPRIGQIDGRTAAFNLDRWNADSYGYAPYTEIFNVTGQPAISLPLAVSRSGLPIGIQFAAPLGEDARLLALAAWLEREQPWNARLAALRRRFL
jgi:amidase